MDQIAPLKDRLQSMTRIHVSFGPNDIASIGMHAAKSR